MDLESKRFLGISSKVCGDGFDGCDCVGLLRLWFKEHGSPLTFSDGEAEDRSKVSDPKNWERLIKYLNTYCNKVDDDIVQYGDVVLLYIGTTVYTGTILNEQGDVLTMSFPMPTIGSVSTVYEGRIWEHLKHKIYRPKEGYGVTS